MKETMNPVFYGQGKPSSALLVQWPDKRPFLLAKPPTAFSLLHIIRLFRPAVYSSELSTKCQMAYSFVPNVSRSAEQNRPIIFNFKLYDRVMAL